MSAGNGRTASGGAGIDRNGTSTILRSRREIGETAARVAAPQPHGVWRRGSQRQTTKYDVFLCHNSADKPMVRRLASALLRRKIKPWFDEWCLIPGRPWQEALEQTIQNIGCATVLVGESGIGPWEDREMRAFLNEFVRRNVSVIPVLLPGTAVKPALPLFLSAFTWIDMREGIRKRSIDRLVWGITGVQP